VSSRTTVETQTVSTRKVVVTQGAELKHA
jgi:hypothetical protein